GNTGLYLLTARSTSRATKAESLLASERTRTKQRGFLDAPDNLVAVGTPGPHDPAFQAPLLERRGDRLGLLYVRLGVADEDENARFAHLDWRDHGGLSRLVNLSANPVDSHDRGEDPSGSVVVAVPRDEALDALLEGRGRVKPGRLLQRLDIGISLLDIARLRREQLDLGLLPKRALDYGDKVEQRDRAVIADIVDAIGRRGGRRVGGLGPPFGIRGGDGVQRAYHPFDRIVDIR